mmetsp:Transcript_47442/g.135399  ORF Transcript_47442/g.135399 Transcript_47442/m.135399 type:complete len:407 (+) Transcript_47442:478-1698(+)
MDWLLATLEEVRERALGVRLLDEGQRAAEVPQRLRHGRLGPQDRARAEPQRHQLGESGTNTGRENQRHLEEQPHHACVCGHSRRAGRAAADLAGGAEKGGDGRDLAAESGQRQEHDVHPPGRARQRHQHVPRAVLVEAGVARVPPNEDSRGRVDRAEDDHGADLGHLACCADHKLEPREAVVQQGRPLRGPVVDAADQRVRGTPVLVAGLRDVGEVHGALGTEPPAPHHAGPPRQGREDAEVLGAFRVLQHQAVLHGAADLHRLLGLPAGDAAGAALQPGRRRPAVRHRQVDAAAGPQAALLPRGSRPRLHLPAARQDIRLPHASNCRLLLPQALCREGRPPDAAAHPRLVVRRPRGPHAGSASARDRLHLLLHEEDALLAGRRRLRRRDRLLPGPVLLAEVHEVP